VSESHEEQIAADDLEHSRSKQGSIKQRELTPTEARISNHKSYAVIGFKSQRLRAMAGAMTQQIHNNFTSEKLHRLAIGSFIQTEIEKDHLHILIGVAFRECD
jgi:hypothetical protein